MPIRNTGMSFVILAHAEPYGGVRTVLGVLTLLEFVGAIRFFGAAKEVRSVLDLADTPPLMTCATYDGNSVVDGVKR